MCRSALFSGGRHKQDASFRKSGGPSAYPSLSKSFGKTKWLLLGVFKAPWQRTRVLDDWPRNEGDRVLLTLPLPRDL